MSLFHYLVDFLKKKNPAALICVQDLSEMDAASKSLSMLASSLRIFSFDRFVAVYLFVILLDFMVQLR